MKRLSEPKAKSHRCGSPRWLINWDLDEDSQRNLRKVNKSNHNSIINIGIFANFNVYGPNSFITIDGRKKGGGKKAVVKEDSSERWKVKPYTTKKKEGRRRWKEKHDCRQATIKLSPRERFQVTKRVWQVILLTRCRSTRKKRGKEEREKRKKKEKNHMKKEEVFLFKWPSSGEDEWVVINSIKIVRCAIWKWNQKWPEGQRRPRLGRRPAKGKASKIGQVGKGRRKK